MQCAIEPMVAEQKTRASGDQSPAAACPGCSRELPRELLANCPHCQLLLHWQPQESPRSNAWLVTAAAVLIQGFVIYSYVADSLVRSRLKGFSREILDFGGSALDALFLLGYFLALPVGIGLVIGRGWFIRQGRTVQWIMAGCFLLLALARPFLTWFPWEC